MRRVRQLGQVAVAVVGAIVVAGCATGTGPERAGEATSPSTNGAGPTALVTAPSPAVVVTSATTVAPAPPATTSFRSTIEPISAATTERMSASWRPGCPVPLDALRLVTVTYWGFDGQAHQGELVVNRGHADDIVSVFGKLHEARFPIEQVRLVDEFGGDDDRSMAANNTSAFNCRRATGSDRWSEHAYGRAIDINPIQNPYVTRTGAVLPPAGAKHANRDPSTVGLIVSKGPVVAAFAGIGWRWGGTWSSGKDYQHFSATGR